MKHYKMMTVLAVVGTTLLQGCQTTTSNVLTHVPQEPLIKAQLHPQKQKSNLPKVNPNAVRDQYLNTLSPEIKSAYYQYINTGKAPVIKKDNFVIQPFNEFSEPSFFCEPLHACDFTLEEGEDIIKTDGGDTKQWIIGQIYSGSGSNKEPHVIVKPKFDGIHSNLIVATNKRTYHIAIDSVKDSYIRQVKYYYPDDIHQNILSLNDQLQKEQQEIDMPQASVPDFDPAMADYHYKISKNCCSKSIPAWMPLSAANDGTHVYIKMPAQMRVTAAPVLFIKGDDGSEQLVNYRIKDNYYVVDSLFKQAVMLSGVGDTQEKVSITYVG